MAKQSYLVYKNQIGNPEPWTTVLPAHLVESMPSSRSMPSGRNCGLLRLPSQEKLFQAHPNEPWFRGLNVLCRQLPPNGPPGQWEPVYQHDPKQDRLEIAEATRDLLRAAFYRDDSQQLQANLLIAGLTTPLPLLARGDYPPIGLPGLGGEVRVAPVNFWPRGFGYTPGSPRQAMEGMAQNNKARWESWKQAPPALRDKLAGNLDPLRRWPANKRYPAGREVGRAPGCDRHHPSLPQGQPLAAAVGLVRSSTLGSSRGSPTSTVFRCAWRTRFTKSPRC